MRRDLLELHVGFPDDKGNMKLQFADERSKYVPMHINGAVCRHCILFSFFYRTS
jgi:Zn-finger protein